MSDTAYVTTMPDCDFCKQSGVTRKAKYDLRTKWGQWANGCQIHYVNNRAHTELGTGHGQLLVCGEPPVKTDEEVGNELLAAIEAGDWDLAEDLCGDRDPMEFL
jgi:hypothetical protein